MARTSEVLPLTSQALRSMQSSQRQYGGAHEMPIIEVGRGGRPVSDALFDASKHRVEDINLLSPMGIALDEPHVSRHLPRKRMTANVVTDISSVSDHPSIVLAKRILALTLHDELLKARPDNRDIVRSYVLTDDDTSTAGLGRARIVKAKPETEQAAHSVAQLCHNGLTFVIGDFKNLRLDTLPQSNYAATVAIKVDHPVSLAWRPNSGIRITPDGREINTKKSNQLDPYNAELQAEHANRVARLQDAGIHVASIVLDPKNDDFGFNPSSADAAISEAVQTITQP